MAQAATAQQTTTVTQPAPGAWQIDTAHASVGFTARHLMVSKVRGRFDGVQGQVAIGDSPETSSVDVVIDAASITTSQPMRDDHLRSADFLDVETFPTLRYRSTRVEQTGEDTLRIEGELTIRDVSLPVTLDATYEGLARDPWGKDHAGFTARAEIDREAFGMTWNQALETGGVLVGRKVTVDIELELIPA